MHRRAYLGGVAALAATPAVSGCLQGDAVLHETNVSATSPTKEWEVELTEGKYYPATRENLDDIFDDLYERIFIRLIK